MLLRGLKYYRDSFVGFNPKVWLLALVTLINRAGTMVVPFLSLYLTEDLHFTLSNVGWIMSCFGLGSVVGSWLGGKLTDTIGFYPTMVWSLLLSGFAFVGVQYFKTFETLCLGIFGLMVIADTFRPAMYVAIRTYSKPENRTRAVSLVRLAINLGFSAGPAVGGLLIVTFGYNGLFWVDGLTCIAAAILLRTTINRKKANLEDKASRDASTAVGSPYKDLPYLLFLFAALLVAATFLQFFSTVPLFFREVHHLTEQQIGLLLGANGFLVFLVEMPLIKYYDNPRFSAYKILAGSTVLILLSFLVMTISSWAGVLIISIVFMSFGEMLNFPFLNRFSMERADRGKAGAYMALFTIAFSVSHIIGHNSGMQLIAHFGFQVTWYIICAILGVATLLFLLLERIIKKENSEHLNTLTK
ncbi:MAG: MFS transporter [Salibacteraceae bacterium]|nr:MFS transporter [Salibacteraceae bacterium]